jgi:hypothetical protein
VLNFEMKTLLLIATIKGIRIERVTNLECGSCGAFIGEETLGNDPGVIYITPEAISTSLLHEMVHAWQWEMGGFQDFFTTDKKYPEYPEVRRNYDPEDWASEDMAWFCEDSPLEVLNLWWDWIPPDLYDKLQDELYLL